MRQSDLVYEGEVAKIQAQGCCLGRYRVLLDGTYYCYLEGVVECRHQDRRYVKSIHRTMLVCETKNQVPCERCEHYAAVAARA
jgi:hypothetical protein